jgi:DNA-binding NarL/FixJ family response regulator
MTHYPELEPTDVLKLPISMNFTQREIECILLTAQGKTLLQISECLRVNPKTVYFYLVGVRNKLTLLMQQTVTSLDMVI